MEDYRLVRTAVVDSRLSMIPAYLPTDYAGARRFAQENRGKVFFCGKRIGGCGWALSYRVCREKVSHWAHHPGAPICNRSYHEDSADHLYIHAGLLRLFGRKPGGVQEDVELGSDGRCRHMQVSRDRTVLRFQFTTLSRDAWEQEDDRLRRKYQRVQWIIGPNAESTARMLEVRKGYVLRTHCRSRNGTREVYVRLDGGAGAFDWIPLHECAIDNDGLVTGRKLRSQQEQHHAVWESPKTVEVDAVTAPQPPVTQPAPSAAQLPDDELTERVRPVLNGLEAAIARDDLGSLESFLAVGKDALDMLRNSGLQEERDRLREIRKWHMDRRSRPTPTNRTPERKQPTTPPISGQRTTRKRPDFQHFDVALHRADQRRTQQRKNPTNRRTKTYPVALEKQPPATKQPAASNSTKSAKPRPPLTGLAADLDKTLRATAQGQTTLPMRQLTGQHAYNRKELISALVTIEKSNPPTAPLLTALIADDAGEVNSVFRDVLVRLGYDYIPTDFGVALAGRTERDRVHAYYAQPSRPMPDSVLPRRSERPR